MELPDHARENQAAWDVDAVNYVEAAQRNWAAPDIAWGIFGVPEAEVGALPPVDGLDVVELGCGTAYFSAWLARRGARPTGVDLSENQLETARRMQEEHDLHFPLLHASAEQVPLPDACADLVLSEYGASLWCRPEAWIAEAARLLRPGGRLVFLTNSLIVALCSPPSGPTLERLVRGQREIAQLRFDDGDGVEFHLAHGDWIALLGRHGLTVTALHELYALATSETVPQFDWMSADWARKWPVEEIWSAVRAPA